MPTSNLTPEQRVERLKAITDAQRAASDTRTALKAQLEQRQILGDKLADSAEELEWEQGFATSLDYLKAVGSPYPDDQNALQTILAQLKAIPESLTRAFPIVGSVAVLQNGDQVTHGIVIELKKAEGKFTGLFFWETEVPAEGDNPATTLRQITKLERDISFLQTARGWSLLGFVLPPV